MIFNIFFVSSILFWESRWSLWALLQNSRISLTKLWLDNLISSIFWRTLLILNKLWLCCTLISWNIWRLLLLKQLLYISSDLITNNWSFSLCILLSGCGYLLNNKRVLLLISSCITTSLINRCSLIKLCLTILWLSKLLCSTSLLNASLNASLLNGSLIICRISTSLWITTSLMSS